MAKQKRHYDIPLMMERYYKNRLKGMNKKAAALKAGYSKSVSLAVKENIEDRPSYQELLLSKGLKREQVVAEHNFVIKQRKDLKAKNTALDMRYKLDNAYPKGQIEGNVPEVKVIIRKKE